MASPGQMARHVLIAGLVSGAAIAATPACALADAPAPAQPNPVTFTVTDPSPDGSGPAADVTTVVVNNDASGQITFQVNAAAPFTKANGVGIFIDADQNRATGDPQSSGADYMLTADDATNGWDLQRWDGTAWAEAPAHATVRVSGGTGTNQLTISVNRSEVGVSVGFNFWVSSIDGNGGPGHIDLAPDTDTWNYQLQGVSPAAPAAPVRLTVVGARAPSPAKAGRDFTLVMVVRRSDTGGFVGSEATLSCSATIGGRRLAASAKAFVIVTVGSTRVTVPVCAWPVPHGARGRTLRAAITVEYAGARVTRHVRERVR